MKASELRIGNLVYKMEMNVNSGKYEFPTRVVDYHILFDSLDEVRNTIEPIPLTKEWLLRFGCVVYPEGFVIDRFRLFYNEIYKFWYVLDNSTGTYISKVEFVHEWQNCFFVLNGEELTYAE